MWTLKVENTWLIQKAPVWRFLLFKDFLTYNCYQCKFIARFHQVQWKIFLFNITVSFFLLDSIKWSGGSSPRDLGQWPWNSGVSAGHHRYWGHKYITEWGVPGGPQLPWRQWWRTAGITQRWRNIPYSY